MRDTRLALEAIGRLPDAEIDIADAALQLARIDRPTADWASASAHLSDLARQAVAAATVLADDSPANRARALSDLLVERFGYRGDVETYDDPANANIISVIERRRGLPVALGVIWLHAAHAAGWTAYGIDFPAHFLIGLAHKGSQVVLDVFNGGTPVTQDGLRALFRRIAGPDAELPRGPLPSMNTRRVLLRLQNNIMTRRLQAADHSGALACIEDMLRIAPKQGELWRQAALLYQGAGQVSAALDCYDRLLALTPPGAAAEQVRAAQAALRSRLN